VRVEAAEKKRGELLAKYGGAEHLKQPEEVEAEERYIEYTETGEIKSQKKVTPKSRFVEDKYNGNHTSVWGTWWDHFQLGYACCHSSIKNSYCSGEEGIAAAEMAKKMRMGLVDTRGKNVLGIVRGQNLVINQTRTYLRLF
jgi:pre-mRNA-processing factor SLU7